MFKTSDTPNQAAFDNDDLIPIESAAGEDQHVLGSVINAIVSNAAASAIANTRFTVLSESAAFEIAKSDGNKAYYRITGVTAITIPTLAGGGYSVGDEVTLVNRDASAKSFVATGVTVNVPSSWQLGFNEVGSPITLICVGATEWDAFGDLEVA